MISPGTVCDFRLGIHLIHQVVDYKYIIDFALHFRLWKSSF